MAVKDLIGRGIGFNPGNVGFIVRHGLSGVALVSGTVNSRVVTLRGQKRCQIVRGTKRVVKIK